MQILRVINIDKYPAVGCIYIWIWKLVIVWDYSYYGKRKLIIGWNWD